MVKSGRWWARLAVVAVVGGWLAWELVDVGTGRVSIGRRELQLSDFEVMVFPPPVRPRLDLLRAGPRRVVLDGLSWLVKGGRGSTTKRVRVAEGFELVLRERRTPATSSLVLLSGERAEGRLRTLRWFRADESGTTAMSQEGSGSLELEWARDADDFLELASTTATTDVVLRLLPAQGPVGRDPVWLVRILAGSTIRWPRAVDGVRLVPRLRPNRTPPGNPA